MPRRTGYVFATDAEGKRAYGGTKRLKEIIDRESGILRRSVRTTLCSAGAQRLADVRMGCCGHDLSGGRR